MKKETKGQHEEGNVREQIGKKFKGKSTLYICVKKERKTAEKLRRRKKWEMMERSINTLQRKGKKQEIKQESKVTRKNKG